MTISNETKVGALTCIAIVLLILGFNFLKGKSFSSDKAKYYAVFGDIQGLASGNGVIINGKQIGSVTNTDGGLDMRRITVTMNVTIPVNIPSNSVAVVSSSLLGVNTLDIKLGDASTYLKSGDTLTTIASGGLLAGAMEKIDPVLGQVKITLHSLDSLLGSVNTIFDANAKNNIKGMLENLNKTTATLSVSSASLQTLLDPKNGALAKTLDNVSTFSGALAGNSERLNNVMANAETTTSNLSKLDFQTTLNKLNETVGDLKGTIAKINSDSGTLGLLINDKRLYSNLTATSNKLNLLLDDVRVNPKRYVNISVFGRKQNNAPLMVPLPDTINAPYLIK